MIGSKESVKSVESIEFYNDYQLDPSYEDKVRKKMIDVDYNDGRQLYNIIKKRREYKLWQPDRAIRRKLIRTLEDIDKKESNKNKRMQNA